MAGISTPEATFPISLDKPVTVAVTRPAKKKREEEEEEEVLVIEGIQVKRDEFVKFDVFINDEDDETVATGGGPRKTEFAGSFVNVPHKQKHGGGDGGGMVINTRLRIGISELLEGLGVDDDDEHVLVKLVPRCDDVHVTISDIKIVTE